MYLETGVSGSSASGLPPGIDSHASLGPIESLGELPFSKTLAFLNTRLAILSVDQRGASFSQRLQMSWLSAPPGSSLTHLSGAGLPWEGERSRQGRCCNWFPEAPEALLCTWRDTGLLRSRQRGKVCGRLHSKHLVHLRDS